VAVWRQRIRQSTMANYSLNMGIAIAREGNENVAVDHLMRAITAMPDGYAAYLELERLRPSALHPETKNLLDRAQLRNPDFRADGERDLAYNALEQGQIEAFAALFLQALDRRPVLSGDWTYGLLALGQHCLHSDRFEQGLLMLEQAAALDGDDPDIQLWLGFAYIFTLQFDKALGAFYDHRRLTPDGYNADSQIGLTEIAVGRIDDAMATLKSALDQTPNHVLLWAQYALALLAGDRLAEAEDACRRSLSQDTTMWFGNSVLGLVRFRQGAFEEAERLHRVAMATAPHPSSWDYSNLGLALAAAGKLGAEECFAKALALQPRRCIYEALQRPWAAQALDRYFSAIDPDWKRGLSLPAGRKPAGPA